MCYRFTDIHNTCLVQHNVTCSDAMVWAVLTTFVITTRNSGVWFDSLKKLHNYFGRFAEACRIPIM